MTSMSGTLWWHQMATNVLYGCLIMNASFRMVSSEKESFWMEWRFVPDHISALCVTFPSSFQTSTEVICFKQKPEVIQTRNESPLLIKSQINNLQNEQSKNHE